MSCSVCFLFFFLFPDGPIETFWAIKERSCNLRLTTCSIGECKHLTNSIFPIRGFSIHYPNQTKPNEPECGNEGWGDGGCGWSSAGKPDAESLGARMDGPEAGPVCGRGQISGRHSLFKTVTLVLRTDGQRDGFGLPVQYFQLEFERKQGWKNILPYRTNDQLSVRLVKIARCNASMCWFVIKRHSCGVWNSLLDEERTVVSPQREPIIKHPNSNNKRTRMQKTLVSAACFNF